MNYKLIYEQLVARGQKRSKIEGYKERHHIIPRCMGGSDEDKNIVNLTAREHFISHKLLVKLHPKVVGLWAAVKFMYESKSDGYILTSRQYRIVREKYSEYRTVPRKITACEVCSKEFEQFEHLSHRFCSLQCWGVSKRGLTEVRDCKYCKESFKVKKTKIQYFCSTECSYASKKMQNIVNLSCPQCNCLFTVKPSYAKTRVYCSRKCNYNSRIYTLHADRKDYVLQ